MKSVAQKRSFLLFLWGAVYFSSLVSLPPPCLSQEIDTLWFEDWERPDWSDDWHADAGTWEVGVPTSGPDTAFSGVNCAATILDGNYSEPANTRLVRHTSFVVPSAGENPRLRFWHWYSFSDGDYGEVQIKVGNGTWTPISNSYTYRSCNVWTYPYIDLSAYADSTVQIAFYFHSHEVYPNPDVSSGWYIDDIAVITGDVVFNNPEGWESGISDWGVEAGTWEIGEPTSGPDSAYSGVNCAATVLGGNYCEPVDSRLISPPFVVPSAEENPRLRFWHWYSFSDGDYGAVHIKVGNGTWTPISNSYTYRSCNVWTYPCIDLSAYADSTVQIAFYFHSHEVYPNPDVSSGWYIDDIVLITGDVVFNNPECWESGMDDWGIEAGTWEIGEPTSGPDSAYSGVNCAATVLGGNYCEPVDSRLISPPFVVPGAERAPALRFWHWYSFAEGDYGDVHIKVGDAEWVSLLDAHYVNTSGGAWTYPYIDLSSYADSTVRIAFYFHSREVYPNPDVSSGWYIDDILIEGLVQFIRGDAEADGDTDLFDALRIIYWLGGEAEEPLCVNAADAEDDEDVDLFDGIRIIYWLGGTAPEPAPPNITTGCGFDPTHDGLSCNSFPPCGWNPKAVVPTISIGSAAESRLTLERAGAGTISVTMTNAEPLVGFSFVIEYDADLMTAQLVDNAGLVTEGFDVFVAGVSEPGVVKVVGVSDIEIADGVEKLPAGTHQVARIFFVEKSTAPLRVANSVMASGYNRALNHHVVVRATPRPTKFRLDQNYPNPFNPQTTIRYTLPEEAQVRLVVYNVAGQKIKTLVNEKQRADYYECVWNEEDAASGVYFYRLQAGDFVETRKMILIK